MWYIYVVLHCDMIHTLNLTDSIMTPGQSAQ